MHVACAKICRLGFVYIKVWSLWHSNVVSLNLERERGKKKLKQLDEKTVNKATKQGCRVCFLTLLSLSKSAHAVNLINPSKINGREQDAKLWARFKNGAEGLVKEFISNWYKYGGAFCMKLVWSRPINQNTSWPLHFISLKTPPFTPCSCTVQTNLTPHPLLLLRRFNLLFPSVCFTEP